jgi:hypothetical protein
MARLDMTARTRIGDTLRARLPKHWRITVGAEGHAFLEVDQDGLRPSHEFHAIGSAVIVVNNTDGGMVHAARYERVKHPPGYAEGRQYHSDVATVNGRGWLEKLVGAIAASVAEADARMSAQVTAEA